MSLRGSQMNRGGQQQSEPALIEYIGDYTYLDISIPHDDAVSAGTGAPTPAIFNQVRSEPLFSDYPSKYALSIVRFTVPTNQIPIQIFPIQPNLPPFNNTDVNLSIYSVTLTWMAFAHQVYLVWDPEDITVPAPSFTFPQEDVQLNGKWQYYSMFSFDHFVRMINAALDSACTLLIADGAPVTAPPFFTYDSTNKLFTLHAQTAYNSSLVNPIGIYLNTALNGGFRNSFDCLRQSYINDPFNQGRDVKYYIFDRITNRETLPAPYGASYTAVQEYNAIANMVAFTSLVITSNSMPARAEWLSTQNNGISPGVSNSSLKILNDFEVLLDTGFETRTFVHYLPTAEYRRLTLQSNVPILTLDFQIYWKDQYDNLYPVMIPAHDIATIKILFEKIRI